MGVADAKIYIYTTTALGRGKVASPMLDHLYLQGKHPVLILYEAELIPGLVWTQMSQKEFPHPALRLEPPGPLRPT